MTRHICVQCGVQYPENESPPASCPICEDVRQYVRWSGQDWVEIAKMRATHKSKILQEAPGVTGIGMTPTFAIGQRALLVETVAGNILWDCIPLLDDEIVEAVKARGGLAGIAISHPHFQSSMLEWSAAFGGVPVHLHHCLRRHIQREGGQIDYWSGETRTMLDGITLVRCGGHFTGSTAMHWRGGAGGKGAILVGDTMMVAQDRRFVSFMYSYPNLIPLNAAKVRAIAEALAPFEFEMIFGGWFNQNVTRDGKQRFDLSVARYLQAIAG